MNPIAIKKHLVFIACYLLCLGCEKDLFDKDDPSVLEKDSFSEGIYMGYFVLQDQNYWCEIEFKGNNYEELLKKCKEFEIDPNPTSVVENLNHDESVTEEEKIRLATEYGITRMLNPEERSQIPKPPPEMVPLKAK